MRTSPRAEDVIATVEDRWGSPCAGCGAALLGQEVALALWMGFGDRARCVDCLSQSVGRGRDDFLREARTRVRRLDCYRAGWEHADRRLDRDGWPAGDRASGLRLTGPEETEHLEAIPSRADEPTAAAHFDAGERSCGELVLELRKQLACLPGGAVLRLVAHDVAAPEDLPAWCGLTGHALRLAKPPVFWIERRRD